MIDPRDTQFIAFLDPQPLVRSVERNHVTGGVVRGQRLFRVRVASRDQPFGIDRRSRDPPFLVNRSRTIALICWRSAWLGYAELVVVEAGLYLFQQLIKEPTIERPSGRSYLVTPAVECPARSQPWVTGAWSPS